MGEAKNTTGAANMRAKSSSARSFFPNTHRLKGSFSQARQAMQAVTSKSRRARTSARPPACSTPRARRAAARSELPPARWLHAKTAAGASTVSPSGRPCG